MNKNNYTETLEGVYADAISRVSASHHQISSELPNMDKQLLDIVLTHSQRAKGVLAVILTSLLYKLHNPKQDVRIHQSVMPGGYSGRSLDTRYITPFLKAKNFPSMAESGWLTRSLEHRQPYTFKYRGSITPNELKAAFLKIMDNIQRNANCGEYLLYLFQGLVVQRDSLQLALAKPPNLPIKTIISYLERHFSSSYSSHGAARLPVIAIQAIYECMAGEVKRFQDKSLLPLERHTASDTKSGKIGDIEVRDERDRPFEGVEVKHGIPITLQLVKDAFNKFSKTPVRRYYILSTAGVSEQEEEAIREEVDRIYRIHGCQVVVNGIEKSLNYYLRLLGDTYEFIDKYVTLLESDPELKFEHKQRWNEIVSGGA